MGIPVNVYCADRLRLRNRLTDRKGRLYRLCSYSQIKKNIEFHFAQMHDAVGLFNYHIDLTARYPFFLIGFTAPC